MIETIIEEGQRNSVKLKLVLSDCRIVCRMYFKKDV